MTNNATRAQRALESLKAKMTIGVPYRWACERCGKADGSVPAEKHERLKRHLCPKCAKRLEAATI